MTDKGRQAASTIGAHQNHVAGKSTKAEAPLERLWLLGGSPKFSDCADLSQGVDGDYYFDLYADARASGVDAATHYHQTGWQEGHDPNAWFDTDWYLEHNPDVAASGMDPYEHYREFGWHEGRDPSPAFATNAYLAANPDVAVAGVAPLDHWLMYGNAEGRDLS